MIGILKKFLVWGALFTLQSCGVKNYMGTDKSIFYLYTPDPVSDEVVEVQQQQAQEYLLDNSVLIEDVAWRYSPLDDMNTFGNNNSQLLLEAEDLKTYDIID